MPSFSLLISKFIDNPSHALKLVHKYFIIRQARGQNEFSGTRNNLTG